MVLAWWLLGETIITSFANEQYTRFLPFNAGNFLVGVSSGPGGEDTLLTATQGGLVFGGYAVAALAFGAFLLRKVETN